MAASPGALGSPFLKPDGTNLLLEVEGEGLCRLNRDTQVDFWLHEDNMRVLLTTVVRDGCEAYYHGGE